MWLFWEIARSAKLRYGEVIAAERFIAEISPESNSISGHPQFSKCDQIIPHFILIAAFNKIRRNSFQWKDKFMKKYKCLFFREK